MIDERHYSFWEEWVASTCKVGELTSLNSLWLTYFIMGTTINKQETATVFKQVLHTVYTSLPDLTGVLFLERKFTLFVFLKTAKTNYFKFRW
jgi:hypothetical protein